MAARVNDVWRTGSTRSGFSNGREVRLEVLRGGEVRGPAQVNVEAGIASFLVATGDERLLELRAESAGQEVRGKWRLE